MQVEQIDFDVVQKRLQRVGAEALKIVGAGVRVAVNTVRDGIAAAAPVGPDRIVHHNEIQGGGLGYSIGARMRKSQGEVVQAAAGQGVGKSQVGFGVQVARGKSSVPYGHFAILGTSDRWTGERTSKGRSGRIYRKKTGKPVMYRGRVVPNLFVERGYEASKGAADARALEEMDKRLKALANA